MAQTFVVFAHGTANNERFNMPNSGFPTLVDAGSGNDLILGSSTWDILYGNLGNDLIFGGGGSDTIYGDNYADPLAAGGNDVLFGDSLHDVIFGGAGNDFCDGGTGNDYIDGGPGDDILAGGNGADTLRGGAGNDVLWGANSGTPFDFTASTTHDGLTGAASDRNFNIMVTGDIIDDGSADVLKGGAGDDHLHGLLGNDVLITGKGRDRLYFETALDPVNNVDDVHNFKPREDTIVLSKAIFTGIGDKLKKGHFVTGKKAKDGNDRIIYDKKSGDLMFDGDGKGGNPAVLFATLDAKLKLSHKDFDMIA